MAEILFKDESYQIVGICMEIHKALGMGLKEINYKDAMEIDFKEAGIIYQREKRFQVIYKNTVLQNPYVSDFIVFNSIILEIKCC